MGLPMDRAQEFAELVLSRAAGTTPEPVVLPTKQLVCIGTPVVDCETFIVSAINIQPFRDPNQEEGAFRCVPPQTTTITAVIARECEGGFDDEGFTDAPEYVAASTKSQTDGDMMFSSIFDMRDYLGPSDPSVSWTIEGGLWIASAQFTIGVL